MYQIYYCCLQLSSDKQDTGFCFSYFATLTTQHKRCVVYGILIKNHQNNLLFSYHKVGFRSLEFNLFSHFFNLKDLNLDKHLKHLRKDLLFVLQLIDLTKCPKIMYVVYASRSAAS